jgi:hypothetical protein
MGLSRRVSNLFGSSSKAKPDYTSEELVKAEAYLKEEGYVFFSEYSDATRKLFLKGKNNLESVDIYLERSGFFKKGTMTIFTPCENGACQTSTSIRDYVKRKEIEAEKNPVKKLLKMIS